MSLIETAKAMNCAVGTVKGHLHRAREKLRESLSDYLEETQNHGL
jgi:DNA-directed RNA polymerase specialized sigma24 family protein